jgi:Tfp pilus assembly protein PilF
LIETALQADPKNSKYLALRTQLGDACAERRKAAAAEAQGFQQARGLLAQKQYCQGKSVLENAMKSAPAQSDWSNLQRQLDSGCEAEHNYDTAQEQFKAGQYCEGMDAIDAAVKADPTNAKYTKLRASLAKGCPIHVP